MPYTNEPVITSQVGNWSVENGISFSTITLIPNIPIDAQIEVERVFNTDRDNNSITDFLTDIYVKPVDKKKVFVIPNDRITTNTQTKVITSINLPSSGNNVYNYTYYKTNAPNVALTIKVPAILANDVITIRRKTVSNIPLVSWVAGSRLTSSQLNLQSQQLLYLAQETLDRVYNLSTTSYDLVFNLANNTVNTTQLVDNSVTTAKIANSNVTTAKIADSNVTTAKIADSNVTTAKIADSNVTTAKIADYNITPSKLINTSQAWSLLGTLALTDLSTSASGDKVANKNYVLDRASKLGIITKDSTVTNNTFNTLPIIPSDANDDVSLQNGGIWFNPMDGGLRVRVKDKWVRVSGPPLTILDYVSTSNVNQNIAGTKTFTSQPVIPYIASGAGAVSRTVSSKLGDVVSVKDFGAVGDGVTDDTAAIQAAINYAGGNSYREVYFPAGQYKVMSPISLLQRFALYADTEHGRATVVAGAAMNAVFQMSTTDSDTNLTSRSSIVGLGISGSSLAQFGIQGKTNHTVFRNLLVQGTVQAAMEIGYGWCNIFENIETSYNGGDGLRLTTESNQVLVSHLRSFLNNGWGIKARGSLGVKFVNCLCEGCKKGGIFFAYGMCGFSIDTCYFEINAEHGHTFTSPTTYTVKADIVINGTSTETTIAAAYPSSGTITNCFSSTAGDAFVFGPGLQNSVIESNCLNGGLTPIPIYRCFGNNNPISNSFSYGSPHNIRIGPNANFKQLIDIDQTANPVYRVEAGFSDAELAFRKTRLYSALAQNLAETDFNKWTVVVAGGANPGTFTRSSVELETDPLVPVWEIGYNAGPSNSYVWGFSLDTSKYTKYHNLWMLFGLWIKSSFVLGSNDGVVDVFANGSSSCSSYGPWSTYGWFRFITAFKMPTSGVKQFGVRAVAAASTVAGTLQVAAPVLCQLGADYETILGNIGNQTQFSGTAAPLAGAWKRGDIIWNLTPSAASDPGWMCVTAGTPGTWKAMANLDA